MLNQVNDAIRKSARLLVLRHPMAVKVLVSRKVFLRDADPPSGSPQLLGGAAVLGGEDEADYELEIVGEAVMLFLGRIAGSEFAVNGLDYGENEVTAYIEPLQDGAFDVRKNDRVAWILPGFVKPYEVSGVFSPSQMPASRLTVFRLQPLEQSRLELAGGAV